MMWRRIGVDDGNDSDAFIHNYTYIADEQTLTTNTTHQQQKFVFVQHSQL